MNRRMEKGKMLGLAAVGVLILACEAGGEDAALPRTIRLGESEATLRPLLSADCGKTERLHYTGEKAAPFTDQVQVNCEALQAFGARRRVEFMFNDGPLGHVWILVRSEEVPSLGETLEKAFGRQVYETKDYRVFASGTVALRRSPPEILVATPEMIARLTGYRGSESSKWRARKWKSGERPAASEAIVVVRLEPEGSCHPVPPRPCACSRMMSARRR